ncbi:MAG: 1-acyl-sn-glycerol-3-phosphate acyltransferase [Chlamydiales bacterium]
MGKHIQGACLTLLSVFVRALLRLRYRLHIVGLDELHKERKKGGILFLPNHPAEIDPVILMAFLWKDFHPRPLVVEHFYYLKWVHGLMRMVSALPLPTIDTIANSWKAKRVEKMVQTIKEGVHHGENFLIYPGGRLKLSGSEILGGSSFLHSLLKETSHTNIVLVRVTGLWGSLFSRALTGKVPDFWKAAWQGCKILLQNGLFFAPRREVKIEFVPAPADLPMKAERALLNRYLENWYNRYPQPGPEPLSLVSYAFWKNKLPLVTKEEPKKRGAGASVSPSIQKDIFSQIATLSRRSPEKIQREMHLSQDLGLDSLDLTQLYLFLDERYGAGDVAPDDVRTVEDLLQIAAGGWKETGDREERKTVIWPEESSRPAPAAPEGTTLAEAFLRACDRMQGSVACADGLSGLLTYKKLKRSALILSLKIKEMKGEKIAIMLPSSVAVYTLILATLLAKKVPVMLNWTAGLRALEHAVELSQIETVISSMRFLGRKRWEI